MATLIPERPSGTATAAVLRVFNLLRKLPAGFTVWHSLRGDHPHFLVLSPAQSAYLLHVSPTSEDLAKDALQLNFLSEQTATPDQLALDELALLEGFALPADLPIRRLLIFPNAAQDTLDQIVLQRSGTTNARFLGLRQTDPDSFLAILESESSPPLPQKELYVLRNLFTPEASIPASSRPTLIAMEKELPTVSAFLDLQQEQLSKLDLQLAEEDAQTAQGFLTRLITGPAGSGKSLVLLHRALHAAQLHPKARLLVLTHNKPVNRQLLTRFQALSPPSSSLVWKTFFEWSSPFLSNVQEIIGSPKMAKRIQALQVNHHLLKDYHPDFLKDELNYLRDLGISSLEDYLALDRTGRLTALRAPARQEIWNLLIDYRQGLQADRITDWHERALQFHEIASQTPTRISPKYDFIFIDEAQFFAAIWFPAVLAALSPTGQLFLSADPTQGFLKRRQSWKGLGINITGRSHRLQRIYRSTREIVTFARQLLTSRLGEAADESIDLPDSAEIATLPRGEKPFVQQVTDRPNSITKTVRLLNRQLAKSPHLAGHILILHNEFPDGIARELEAQLGAGTVHNLQAARNQPVPSNPLCLISTFHAATGLEAPVVILLGLDKIFEKENDPNLTPEERSELISSQSRLLYVATTRAISRLIILTKDPQRFDQFSTTRL